MMRLVFYLFILICVVVPSIGKGNDILSDFKKMNERYLHLKQFGMDVRVSYIGENNKTLMSQTGKVVYSKELHYTEMSGIVTLMKKNEFVSVNKSQRILVYNKAIETKTQDSTGIDKNDISLTLDSLWANQKNLKYTFLKSKKGIQRVYIEDSNNSYYNGYLITYSTKDFRLIQYSYYIKPEQKSELLEVRIDYLNETRKPDLKSEFLNVSYYVKGKAGRLSATSRFSSFKLIDQTIKTKNYEG